jgi:hypothetical protein
LVSFIITINSSIIIIIIIHAHCKNIVNCIVQLYFLQRPPRGMR